MTVSRRQFIALAGGSAAASMLAACGSDSGSAASGGGETEIEALDGLLKLEYVEAGFYAALAGSKVLDAKATEALGKFEEEEQKHVDALTKAIVRLGGDPTPKPKTSFSLEDEAEALEIASGLENIGAAAYLGQLPSINDEAALERALSIHSVEGRHAAAINVLLGKPTTPDGAFAKPATMDQALEAVEPFLAS